MNTQFHMDFMGIGAMRCGTTWLYETLKKHPDIHLPVKEAHFFDNNDNFDTNDNVMPVQFEKYQSLFLNPLNNQITGEITPKYIFHEASALRISKILPDLKLILILRNPVARAISQFRFAWQNGNTKSKGIFCMKELEKKLEILTRGLYYNQIKTYHEVFPRSQLKIILFEDLVTRTEKILYDLYSFLGLGLNHKNENLPPLNASKYIPFPESEKEMLQDYYNKEIDTLEKYLGISLQIWKS